MIKSWKLALRALALGFLLHLGLGSSALAQGMAEENNPSQFCLDSSVIACFDECNDPNNFQECIIGCATGANLNPQNCLDQCFNDPVCLDRCQFTIRTTRSCGGPSDKLRVTAGTPTYNRTARIWQQTVRVTNKTLAEDVDQIAIVVTGAANGWTLSNADGNTSVISPSGNPFKNVPGVLAPGASVQVRLTYSRSGNLPLVLVPKAYASIFR
ncbi:hypothetical protein JI742_09755 [Piscinibacter sp. Jin2]|uniref:Uncharacterized protein n=1 Tax=Aquariibacter lacus TaxID=2801332 RepID=A0A9X0XFK4_9BURK|nr:hypothetical protein [Piscinibacter lacus]MBL0720173.1 hypothetical protein [Piscinibacter lacus]